MAQRLLKAGYLIMVLAGLCVAHLSLRAQTQTGSDATASDADKSWTATSEQPDTANPNPTRTTETHTVTNGRTVDRQTFERVGTDGRYQPYLDFEKESIRVDATTERIVKRSFGRDPDGQKHLTQMIEEEIRTLPGGDQKLVRTSSNPDVNGRLQIVRREIQDAKQISSSVRETKTTTLSPNANGDLTPILQTEERETRGHEKTRRRRHGKTWMADLPLDLCATERRIVCHEKLRTHWRATERRGRETQREKGKDRVEEERVLRPDLDGKFAVAERTVTREPEGGPGERRQTVETYSTEIPGASGDGSLHLNQRVTTVHRQRSDGGNVTEEQIEERNPAAPADNPRITQKTIDIVRPSAGGTTSETKTLQSLDSNGNLAVVWIDTSKTDKTSSVQVDTRTPPKSQ